MEIPGRFSLNAVKYGCTIKVKILVVKPSETVETIKLMELNKFILFSAKYVGTYF